MSGPTPANHDASGGYSYGGSGQYDHYGPQHAQYDANGYPIPPGYVPPQNPPPGSSYDPNNFPPPPRSDYPQDGYSEYDRHYDRAPPSSEYTMPPAHSGYGNDGRNYDGALATYSQSKADEGYRREDEYYRRPNVPPPPSDEELRRSRYEDTRYDDRYYDRYDDRSEDRYYDDRDKRSSYYDDRSSYDSREKDRRRNPRRRDSRNSPPKASKKDIFGGREGERGLGAQILGGAAGGLAGHEFGGGILETLGGAVAGAIGAKILENQHEKRKNRKDEERRASVPYKRDMMSPRERERDVVSPRDRPNSSRERWPRDDRGDITRERRRSVRRSDSDSYSSDGSPPRRRRRG